MRFSTPAGHGRAMSDEDPLVRVAGGRNQVEAELIADLLRQDGIPSLIQRSAGFDVPDYLAAGPRDVLVRASHAHVAFDLLQEHGLASRSEREVVSVPAVRVLLALVVGVAVIAAVSLLAGVR